MRPEAAARVERGEMMRGCPLCDAALDYLETFERGARWTRITREGFLRWHVAYVTPGEGMGTETTHLTVWGARRYARRWLDRR